MRPFRPASAVLAALTVAAVAVPAAATTTTTTPSTGLATTDLALLTVDALGQSVVAGDVTGIADTRSSRRARIVLTVLDSSVTGSVHRTVVTPSSSPSSALPSTSVSLPGGLGDISGPKLTATARTGALTAVTAAASALGTVHLLGLPLDLTAVSLSDGAQVSAGQAVGQKRLTVGTVGLPSIADLLTGLGLDVSKLTQDQLSSLAGVVEPVLDTTITTLNVAVDTLQATVAGAPDTVAGANTALTNATGDLAANLAQLSSDLALPVNAAVLAALDTALTTAGFGSLTLPLTVGDWKQMTSTEQNLVETGVTTLDSTLGTLDSAVDDAQTLVDDLVALVGAVTDAIGKDPLAVLTGVDVTAKAVASATPTASAALTIGGVDVLGKPLASVAALTSTLTGVLNSLAGVLNGLAGVTFTPPSVALGTPTTDKGRSGTTRHAAASITAVTLTLPTVTLPASLSLSGAAVSTPKGTVRIGRLAESARWTPAVTHTIRSQTPPTVRKPVQQPPASGPTGAPTGVPTTGRTLPLTGMSPALPVAALLVVGVGLALARRRSRGTP